MSIWIPPMILFFGWRTFLNLIIGGFLLEA
nr:MAG TPA: hypothetical protein [Caudoviricetes sp.]